MSDYTKATNFTVKDSLPSGNSAKIIKGSEFDAEFNAIAVAVATKVDATGGTGAAEIPSGTELQRPSVPAAGMFRFNADFGSFEGYDGSAWAGVGGASGGAGNPFVYLNDQTVSADYTMPADQNGSSTGPLTINSGVTVTISSGARWVIL